MDFKGKLIPAKKVMKNIDKYMQNAWIFSQEENRFVYIEEIKKDPDGITFDYEFEFDMTRVFSIRFHQDSNVIIIMNDDYEGERI